jgi:hypothetical protein
LHLGGRASILSPVPEQTHTHATEQLEPRRLERAATWLSFACAVHCLAVPVIGGVLPALGASQLVRAGSGLDAILSVLVVISVGASAALGYVRHRDNGVLAGMGFGLAIYLTAHALEGTSLHLPLSVLGALVLGGASFVSARQSQACNHEH